MAERPEESEAERLDRELMEMIQELRVIIPGVQVLFGVLLAVPFAADFGAISDLSKDVYFAAVLLSAVTTMLLLAPSAQHRVLFREGEKEYLLRLGNVCAITASVTLATAVGATIYVIADVTFDALIVRLTGPIFAITAIAFWLVVPALKRQRS